jgi:hypothetical protein
MSPIKAALSSMSVAISEITPSTALRMLLSAADSGDAVVVIGYLLVKALLNFTLYHYTVEIMGNVIQDERFEKSVRRLMAMGIKLYVDTSDPKNAYVLMDIDSIMAYFVKRITYPTSETWIDGNYMITHVWKGEKPTTGITPPAGSRTVNAKGETQQVTV